MSVLQVGSLRKQLRGNAAIQISTAQACHERAIANLVPKAEKLKSPVLVTPAMKIGADLFSKLSKIGAGVD